MKKTFIYISDRMRSNWKAGLTVALVSLPLSVSLAVASGATPTIGIIAAIWGGLFASLFGGSHFNVVGPTGALSGVIAVFVASHGVGALPMLSITAGILVLIAWRFRLEKFIRHIPEHTIHGFTIGVAVTIVATQLGNAFGVSLPQGIGEQWDKIVYYLVHIKDAQSFIFLTFAIFLGLLFTLKKILPKVPSVIVLSPVGILFGYLVHNRIIPATLPTLGDVFPNMVPQFTQSHHVFFTPYLILPALGIALIAIIETGISATIADNITGTKHDSKKEVFGLALGNIASGIFGGLPVTAALARTSLNIKSGADHKTSGIINAICIVLISFVFLSSFQYIPMAVIAAILTFVAYQLIERDVLVHSWKNAHKQFWIIMLVAFVCVYKDTIWGIAIGVCIGLIGNLTKFTDNAIIQE